MLLVHHPWYQIIYQKWSVLSYVDYSLSHVLYAGANHRQPHAMGGQNYCTTNDVDMTVDSILHSVLRKAVGYISFVVESYKTPSTPIRVLVQQNTPLNI